MLQQLAAQNSYLHRQPSALIVVEQDTILAEFLLEHLVLGPQVLDDRFLLTVDPAGQDQEDEGCRMNRVSGGWWRSSVWEK
jgi:hypothetical protein